MQKKLIQELLFICILILILSGCEQKTPNDTNGSVDSVSPLPSAVETTRSLDSSPSPNPAFLVVNDRWRAFENSKEYDIDDKTYFLATYKLLTNGNETGYMLYCLDRSSGNEEPLNILAYDIDTFGKHIYLLVYNGEDVSFPVSRSKLNTLYRLEDDDSILPICSGYSYYDIDDILRVIDDSLYFTRCGENAIFKADLDCEKIESISIILPEENDPMEYSKITACGELFAYLEIVTVEENYIFFTYKILNESNECHFYGYYKLSIDDNHIEKIYSAFYDYKKVIGSWLYYIDLEHPIYSEYQDESLYELHRRKLDGSRDENLKVQCFRFNTAGEYLYADTNLWYGDFAHWSTLRYNLDGTGQKQLDYYNMVRYYDDDRMYFTQFDENIIHVADTACNELLEIEILVPDDNALRTEIGAGYEFGFITVVDKEDDWLIFEYEVTDTGPFTYYRGLYRVNLQSSKIEKVDDGEFFTPSWDY